MTGIRFYHLNRSTVEQALPSLLEKALSQQMRAVVVAGSEERLSVLDGHLWTYRPDSFLPHGTYDAANQPVYLSLKAENPNQAQVLFLVDATDDTEAEALGQFTLCCDLFDGNDDASLMAARERWKMLKEAGHELTYWQQGERGWEKKA